MFLFIGLGNYGTTYQSTLHNAGFIVIDQILHTTGIAPEWREKFSGLFCVGEIFGTKTLFIKPQTYMNNSGICVSQFKNFYKIENNHIFVFHDDIDLKPMQIKIKQGGSHAGHNGLKSLDSYIGQNYHRIRIGIGRPASKEDVSNFVLSKFTNQELQNLTNEVSSIINFAKDYIQKNNLQK